VAAPSRKCSRSLKRRRRGGKKFGVSLVIVEFDGAPHFEADDREYDAERTNYLEELGMKVIG